MKSREDISFGDPVTIYRTGRREDSKKKNKNEGETSTNNKEKRKRGARREGGRCPC